MASRSPQLPWSALYAAYCQPSTAFPTIRWPRMSCHASWSYADCPSTGACRSWSSARQPARVWSNVSVLLSSGNSKLSSSADPSIPANPLLPVLCLQNECLLPWGCLKVCLHFVAWPTFSLVHCARGSGANGAGRGRHASGPGVPQRSHRVPFQIRTHSHRTHLLLGESQLERQNNHIRVKAFWSAGGKWTWLPPGNVPPNMSNSSDD